MAASWLDFIVPAIGEGLSSYAETNLQRSKEQEVQRRKDAEAAQRREWEEKVLGMQQQGRIDIAGETDRLARGRSQEEWTREQPERDLAAKQTEALIRELEARTKATGAETTGKLTEQQKGLIAWKKGIDHQYDLYAANEKLFGRVPVSRLEYWSTNHPHADSLEIEKMELRSLGVEPIPSQAELRRGVLEKDPETRMDTLRKVALLYPHLDLNHVGSPTTPTASASPPPPTQPTTRDRLSGALFGGAAGADTLGQRSETPTAQRPEVRNTDFENMVRALIDRARQHGEVLTREQAEAEAQRILSGIQQR